MVTTHSDIVAFAKSSRFLTAWHWYSYHFRQYVAGAPTPFVAALVTSCLEVDERIPGFAISFLESLASLGGVERHKPHYEQLSQRLAELLVIRRIVQYSWGASPTFDYEPEATTSRKNPEITVTLDPRMIGVEVKAPSLLEHEKERERNPVHIPARGVPRDLDIVKDASRVTLPRDYPMRDFLKSADDKFAGFYNDHLGFSGLLVIVWDDHVYEPLSALIAPQSGLLTPNTWARDKSGQPLQYPHVGGVVLIRHLHVFRAAAAEQHPLPDHKMHAFYYGLEDEFPPKVFIENPFAARPVDSEMLECLQAIPPGPELGAEYVPSDLIIWT
jgi:hypothetical protein